MITVSSCGVKLQEVLLGLEKKACNIEHTRALLWLFSTFLSIWGVIFKKIMHNLNVFQYVFLNGLFSKMVRYQAHSQVSPTSWHPGNEADTGILMLKIDDLTSGGL